MSVLYITVKWNLLKVSGSVLSSHAGYIDIMIYFEGFNIVANSNK